MAHFKPFSNVPTFNPHEWTVPQSNIETKSSLASCFMTYNEEERKELLSCMNDEEKKEWLSEEKKLKDGTYSIDINVTIG